MKSNITRYFLSFFLFLICISCTDNDLDSDTNDSGVISFKVEMNSEAGTKATEPGDDLLNENKINRLDVIFFNGESIVLYPAQSDLTYNSTSKVLTIKISNTNYNLFNGTTSYKRLVFANLSLPRSALEGKTYSQIRALVAQSDFTSSPQPDFLMDFTDNTTLSFAHPVLGIANLKRAAVKIRTSIKRLDAPTGYTALKSEVQFINYLDKTSLTDGAPYNAVIGTDYKSKAYTQIGMPAELFNPKVINFLTYENDWTYDRQREPYLRVKVRWKKNSDNTEFDGYYKAPFSYLNSPNINDGLAYKLLRNTIYDIGFNISGLGSTDPENPETIASNFTLKDWTSKEILASFLQFNYMVVHELFVNLYNKNYREIGYSSSLPIEVVNISATCDEYDINGNKTTRTYVSGNPEFPSVVVDPSTMKLKVTSTIPINYVPKKITFTVRTIGVVQITQQVVINQYPPIYVTATQSTDTNAGATNGTANFPNGGSGQTNFNFFKITTVVPTDNIYKTGDPRQYNGSVMTSRTDIEGNNLRSPQFIIASQRGITYEYNYSTAQGRCQTYQELPYARGKWRIPTKAEIMLIDLIQDDSNSAVKRLLIGPKYWSALMYDYYDFTNNVFTSTNSNGTAFIRCVTDTWDIP